MALGALGPLLSLLGIAVLVIGTLTFWAAIQNWMAGMIQRAQTRLGTATHTLQSALVVVDRVVVNGQRVILATGRAVFQNEDDESVTQEEVRSVAREDLPSDIRERLEAGEPISYELSIGAMKVQHAPTHKLVVRRTD